MACHRVNSEVLCHMSKGEVQKGYHCAWQIHYHIVFPVKYRKALLVHISVTSGQHSGISGHLANH